MWSMSAATMLKELLGSDGCSGSGGWGEAGRGESLSVTLVLGACCTGFEP